jgi:hypothetical protein
VLEELDKFLQFLELVLIMQAVEAEVEVHRAL